MPRRFPSSLHDLVHDLMFSLPVLDWVEDHPGSVLLESNIPGGTGRLFTDPRRLIVARSMSEVPSALEELDHSVAKGFHAAGFLSYEAGYAFETVLPKDRQTSVPLIWFGVFDPPRMIRKRRRENHKKLRNSVVGLPPPDQTPLLSEGEYTSAVKEILRFIATGDTYQVNFTFPLRMRLPGPASRWYDALRRVQRVRYSAFVNTGDHRILSLSPELLFLRVGSKLVLKPMKGTAPRGRTANEDEGQIRWLKESQKNRSENLMIVDLLRNDAGRIAMPGGVNVKKFFEIEKYETVFQATSTIEARLRKDVTIPELLRSVFPSGSVTGAPKIRTMQIIHDLERHPRGVYTGSIGYFAPNRKAELNVAIRTIVAEAKSGGVTMGVGSGIVHDSDPREEYRECLLKARFASEPADEFQLLETIRWDPGRGWSLLAFHKRRLKSSCAYFGFMFNGKTVNAALGRVARSLARSRQPMRIRVLLYRNGFVETQTRALRPLPANPRAALSASFTHSADRFLFHKTTRRKLYDDLLGKAERQGLFDVIFLNERGEVTEGARTNVVVKQGEKYYTPPIECGLLAGTYRAYLLQRKGFPIEEKVLHPDDLFSADEVYLCNALRGLVRVTLIPKSPIS